MNECDRQRDAECSEVIQVQSLIRGTMPNDHQLDGLKQQKFFSQFYRSVEGVGEVMLSLKT